MTKDEKDTQDRVVKLAQKHGWSDGEIADVLDLVGQASALSVDKVRKAVARELSWQDTLRGMRGDNGLGL